MISLFLLRSDSLTLRPTVLCPSLLMKIMYVQFPRNSFIPNLRRLSWPQHPSLHLNKRNNTPIYDPLVCSISYSTHTETKGQPSIRPMASAAGASRRW